MKDNKLSLLLISHGELPGIESVRETMGVEVDPKANYVYQPHITLAYRPITPMELEMLG